MIRIVKLTFKPEFVDLFLQLFEERKVAIRNVEGCNLLELWHDKQDVNSFYTYSIWQHEFDLENYRTSAFFQDTWSLIKPWFGTKAIAFSTEKLISMP
jgi:(4S)-4-hydroxy-5-phosphonooxypentane-2,3-dione isomerase